MTSIDPSQYPTWSGPTAREVFGNLTVVDPYRGLENQEDPATQEWLVKQAHLANDYFAPNQRLTEIQDRLSELMNFEKIGVPWQKGDRLFHYRNMGLQNQSVLIASRLPDGKPEIILDPNLWSVGGSQSISGLRISKDHRWLAYGQSTSGSDWSEWHIRNIDTKEDLPDVIKGIRYALVSWSRDSLGFYYAAVPDSESAGTDQASKVKEKIFYHRIGTPQSKDEVVFSLTDQADTTLCGKMSEDCQYLLAITFRGADDHNMIYVKDVTQANQAFFPVVADFSAAYVLFAGNGPRLWFRTNWQAPNGQIIEIDVSNPEHISRRVIVAERQGIVERASVLDNKLFVTYLQNGCSVLSAFDLDGQFLYDANVPQLGSIGGFDGQRSQHRAYFSFTSYTQPHTVYEYDAKTNTSTVHWKNKLAFQPEDFVTTQVMVERPGKVQVPMFVSHHKRVVPDKNTPTYLYGYGGFAFCHKPFYSTANLAWMEAGGVFCLANIRGGGELGAQWHEAGRGPRKQNSFDDFIACGEWLIERGKTQPSKLAIGGRSNGGLLVGACLTQRPDLFRAAIAAVGLFDMTRFHKFTIGWAWRSEYGDPDAPEDLQHLLDYSPLHCVKRPTHFPAVLVATSTHDNRVSPTHSYKFAAALQAAQSGKEPIILRVEENTGHGAGKPTSKYLEEIRDFLFFLRRELQV